MSHTAFELADDYVGNLVVEDDDGNEVETDVPIFGGGNIAVGDGHTFDVKKALGEGDGTILVENTTANVPLLEALRAYPVLTEGRNVEPGLDKLTKTELQEQADQRGLDVPASATKADLIDAIEAAGGGES